MSSGNRSTLTINWRWYRHAAEYTQETRHNFFLPRDFAGIGSAPRTIDRDKVLALREQDVGATNIARQMKIGRTTVYKILIILCWLI